MIHLPPDGATIVSPHYLVSHLEKGQSGVSRFSAQLATSRVWAAGEYLRNFDPAENP
jgi:hypothetical protein